MAKFDLKQKYGPLPLWGWFLASAAGIYLLMRMRQRSAAPSSEGGGTADDNGQFSSTITRTDPVTGEQVTYSASGRNSGIQSPAQLVYGAGNMPYSGGDVYVNYPGQSTSPPAVTGSGFWYITPHDAPGGKITDLIKTQLIYIVKANPQIDWSGLVRAGTPIWIPQAPESPPGDVYAYTPQPPDSAPPTLPLPPTQSTITQAPSWYGTYSPVPHDSSSMGPLVRTGTTWDPRTSGL